MILRIQALLARMLFAFAPGVAAGLVMSVIGDPLMGIFMGIMLCWAGWDMTRPVPSRGEGKP